ncbi:MAG: hypothetical protein K5837_01190 [Candidatus Saccharibacteria bacterium]|nr:hypothetical protein [Candidatus Saccharibacteria bacterium]
MDNTEIYLRHDNGRSDKVEQEEPSTASGNSENDDESTADNAETTQGENTRLVEAADETFRVNHEELEPGEIDIVPAEVAEEKPLEMIGGDSSYPLPTPEIGDMPPPAPPKHNNGDGNIEKSPA